MLTKMLNIITIRNKIENFKNPGFCYHNLLPWQQKCNIYFITWTRHTIDPSVEVLLWYTKLSRRSRPCVDFPKKGDVPIAICSFRLAPSPPPHTSMEYTSDSTKDYTVVKYTLIWGNCSSCSRGLAWQHTILNLLAILQSPLDRSFRAIYIYMYCRDHDFVSVHFFTE